MKTTIGYEPIGPIVNSHGDAICAGLTKREYFAAMAMQAVITHYGCGSWSVEEIVQCADALIAEMNREQS